MGPVVLRVPLVRVEQVPWLARSAPPVTVDGAVTAATPATRPWSPNAMVRPVGPVALAATRLQVLPDAAATAATVARQVSLPHRAVSGVLVA